MPSDTEQQTSVEPAWGAPTDEPVHWSRNKTLAAVGIAALLAAGAAAVIYAAGGSSESSGPGGGPGWGGPPGGPGFGGPGQGQGPAPADALHGQFVVPDGHGGFNTESTQTGTVTGISDTSVTARSADGFTQTYVITTDTRHGRQPVHAGDSATIRAVQRDAAFTVTVISPAG